MVSSFLAKDFHFHEITLVVAFDFSRISKTNLETSVEFVQGHFLNHPAYFFSKTDHLYIERHFVLGAEMYPAHCTSLELLHESPQNKLCYRLHPKYTGFSCFPIICSFAVFLRNTTYTIFDILKEAD